MKRILILIHVLFCGYICPLLAEDTGAARYQDSILKVADTLPATLVRLTYLRDMAYKHQYAPYNMTFSTRLYEEARRQKNAFYENMGAYYLAACTGFVVAYNTAAAYLNAGVYQTALIIGSESLSNLTNWKDRGTCILFGDGAGAAVLKSEDMRYYLPVTHSDGSKGEALCCRSRYDRSELSPEDLPKPDEKEYLMQMDGREVFMFAVKSVPQAVKEVLEKNNVAQEEISFYILHQANKRIVEAIAKRLGEPLEKFPMNLEEYGNTSSASIPILLDELNRAGKLQKGQKIILAGFGAGLTWGASILEW